MVGSFGARGRFLAPFWDSAVEGIFVSDHAMENSVEITITRKHFPGYVGDNSLFGASLELLINLR
jgi:hypothetical protein